MPNQPSNPKPQNQWEKEQRGWRASLKQKAPIPNRRELHVPKGLGKHRKSFGHV